MVISVANAHTWLSVTSCGCKEPDGGVPLAEGAKTLPKWHFEYRTGVNGEKIWSNSLCQPCHK